MDKAWAGVDGGKEFPWVHVLDASGRELLSRKVENDEADVLKLIDEALSFAKEVVWALDQPGGSTALLLALLWERNQRVLYVPGLTVDRARDTYIPTAVSPKPMPVMPTSLLIRRGCDQTSASLHQVSKSSPSCSFSSLAAETL